MKKTLALVAVMATLAVPAFAVVKGSKHDLTSTGGASAGFRGTNDDGQVCVYCHTPHGAANPVAGKGLPLWNRDTLNATDVYTNTTLRHSVTLAGANNSDAPLCLSCHGGSALANLTNPPNTAGFTQSNATIGGNLALGADLKNDHPIGFVFDAALKAELQAPTTAKVNFGTGADEMWCSSCHDVHGGAVGTPFLVMSNTNSALCLDCHVK